MGDEKMVTNQIMRVKIYKNLPFDGELNVGHKTGDVDVNQLLKMGNYMRVTKGKKSLNSVQLLKYTVLKEFCNAVREEVDNGEYAYFEVNKDLIRSTGRGRNSTTYAFLPVALKMAGLLDVSFEARLYRIFIEDRLLKLRDDGGNNFKKLNRSIDLYLGGRDGKTNNRGCYIQSAKLLRKKIFENPEHRFPNVWNSEYATSDKLALREDYENKLSTFLQFGLVTDFDHLKELIDKL